MTFGILRLGDAVQRWLRHPEPSSWSYKSTREEKYLCVFLRVVEGADPCLGDANTHASHMC